MTDTLPRTASNTSTSTPSSTSTSPPSNASMRRILTGLVPLNLLVQACSFASSVALARVFGATASTDAYYLGLSIPLAVYVILMAAVKSGAIPGLVERAREGGQRELEQSASEMVSAVLVASVVLTIFVTALALLILPLAIGGASGATTRVVLLELAPLGVLGPLTGALTAVLAARRLFALGVLVLGIEPLLKSVLTLSFGHTIGISALIIGNLAGSSVAVAVLWCRAHHVGLRIRLRAAFLTPFVRGVAATTAPLVISQSVLQTNPVLDRTMASQLGAGSVTALDLGLRLCVIPAALLTTLMTTPLTVTWTETKLQGGWEALRPNVATAIVTVATFVPPLVAVGFVFRREIVGFVYQGGAYSSEALGHTTGVFGMIILSLPAQVVIFMLVTLFVIEKDTVFPMLVGITNVILNAALNFALRPFLGVEGIALSTTITAIILCGAYVVAVQRRWGALSLAGRWHELVIAAGATVLAAAAAVGVVGVLPAPTSRLQALAAVALGGGLILAAYAVVALVRGRSVLGAVRAIRSTSGLEA